MHQMISNKNYQYTATSRRTMVELELNADDEESNVIKATT